MMVERMLNNDDINKLLQNFCKSQNVKYISSKILPLSSSVEGFMGDYFTLDVNYELDNQVKTENFFVKTMPTHTGFQAKQAQERNLYGKEIFFLSFLLDEYEVYGLDPSFAPRCYFCKNNQMLIMENLLSHDYVLSTKNKLYDLEQCKAGMEALALYHGSSLLFEEKKTLEQGRLFRLDEEYADLMKENYYDLSMEQEFSREILKKNINAVNFMMEQLTNEKKYNEGFKQVLTIDNILSCFLQKTDLRKAVGHGDLWHNNIFFKYENSKAVKCKFVDYQILRYFYPAYDVFLFIHLNTDKEFRNLYMPYLLKFYYFRLTELFAENGFNILNVMSVKEFNETLNLVEFSAMFNVLSIGTLTFMSQEMLKRLFELMDDDTFGTHYKLFCDGFINAPNYRKKLTEVLDDLHESYYKSKSKIYF